MTSRSCSTRYWLLIGRPIRAVAAPVDLADVVVGEVVADRLELGAEAERAARPAARLAEAALADGEREPARRRQVGVDEQLGVARRRAWSQRREAERARRRARRPAAACGARGAAATSCASSPPSASCGVELDVRRPRLAHADRRPSASARSTASGRRARRARRSAGRAPLRRAAAAARRARRRASAPASADGEQRADHGAEPTSEREHGRARRGERRPPRRAASGSTGGHRGTGAVERGADRVVGVVALELGLRRAARAGGAAPARAMPRRRRRASRSRGPRARAAAFAATSRWTAARGLAPSVDARQLARARARPRRGSGATSSATRRRVDLGARGAQRPRRARPTATSSSDGRPQTPLRASPSIRSSPSRRRVADVDLHEEAVELRLGQRVGALVLDRVLRRDDEERVGQRRGVSPSTDTWRSCIASSSAACVLGGVRLISSASSRFVNTGPGRNASSPPRSVHRAGEVGRQHVGRELHAAELEPERPRDGAGEQRLGDARRALEQHVAADARGRRAASRTTSSWPTTTLPTSAATASCSSLIVPPCVMAWRPCKRGEGAPFATTLSSSISAR